MDRIKQFRILSSLCLIVFPFGVVASLALLILPHNINFSSPIDSSTINGILTAIAIVFGFVSYEAREIKAPYIKFFFISVVIAFLSLTTESYFVVEMASGQANKSVLFIAMYNLVFNIYCSFVVIWARGAFEKEEDKPQTQKSLTLWQQKTN
jgi:hypothetical protein